MKLTTDCIRNYGGKNLVNKEYIFSEMCQGCSPSKGKYKKNTDFVDTMTPKVSLNQPMTNTLEQWRKYNKNFNNMWIIFIF